MVPYILVKTLSNCNCHLLRAVTTKNVLVHRGIGPLTKRGVVGPLEHREVGPPEKRVVGPLIYSWPTHTVHRGGWLSP
jgi:hypothetical protein